MVRIGLGWEKKKKEHASPLRYGIRGDVGSADMWDPLIRCEEWGGKCDVWEKEGKKKPRGSRWWYRRTRAHPCRRRLQSQHLLIGQVCLGALLVVTELLDHETEVK